MVSKKKKTERQNRARSCSLGFLQQRTQSPEAEVWTLQQQIQQPIEGVEERDCEKRVHRVKRVGRSSTTVVSLALTFSLFLSSLFFSLQCSPLQLRLRRCACLCLERAVRAAAATGAPRSKERRREEEDWRGGGACGDRRRRRRRPSFPRPPPTAATTRTRSTWPSSPPRPSPAPR